MKLEKLPKTTSGKKKRLGRGYGSGKGGHTVGRGAKGLKARGKVPLTFEGTKIKKSLLKRLPLRRGKGRFKPLKPGPLIVNVRLLNLLPKGSTVDIQTLAKHGVIKEADTARFGVKILGDGELKTPLTVKLPCSRGAVKKIEKAGGKVVTGKLQEEKARAKKTKTRIKKTTKKAIAKKVAKVKSKTKPKTKDKK